MADDSLLEFVLDQMASLPEVTSRRMFGGHGLYLGEEFFGMVWRGRVWFRTDARSRPEYRALGAVPIPFGDPGGEKCYWSVPEDVLEDPPRLVAWARAAAATPRPVEQRKAARTPPRRGAARGAPARRRGTRGGRRSTRG